MNKQIEEMVKDYKLCYPCEMFCGYVDKKGNLCGDISCILGNDCTKCDTSTYLARFLVKQGYRKIDEGSVVLTKDIVDHIRKETAKEILQDLICYIEQNKELFCSRHKNINYTKADNLIDYIGQRAKQYGVEIEQ